MSSCVSIVSPDLTSIAILVEGLRNLGIGVLELKKLHDECGKEEAVDFAFRNEQGDVIGVRAREGKPLEFVLKEPEKASVKTTLDQVRQAYSRVKVLDEAKRKGYQQVKEEKLPDGSIRLVVQRWR